MYKLLKQENRARRGEFHTVHGTIQTPAFMNVATAAAIKGGLSAYDLREIKCQVMLSNTYHLHLRPGDENVRKLGGIHKFTGWQGPVLTDSGGGDAPVVTRTVYPTYRGALVVCQGADRAEVRLAVTEAVTALTGLTADRVTVAKSQ